MPAAAVIPAPIAYIKVVVVKKLVVGSQPTVGGPLCGGYCRTGHYTALFVVLLIGRHDDRYVYFEKIRVLKAGRSPEYCCME